MRTIRWAVLLTCVIVVYMQNARVVAQHPAGASSLSFSAARDDLIRSIQSESKKGTTISYTQAYGPRGRRVEFHGSIFGVIQGFQADGCELKIESVLVDLYSGSIGGKLVGRTQTKYATTIDFKLTPKMAADLKAVTARPVQQLAEGTNAVCAGGRQCDLTWLKLTADAPVIREVEVADDLADYNGDVKDFDGWVSQVFLPVSSVEAGNDLIAKMRGLAQSCVQ